MIYPKESKESKYNIYPYSIQEIDFDPLDKIKKENFSDIKIL